MVREETAGWLLKANALTQWMCVWERMLAEALSCQLGRVGRGAHAA